MSEEKIKEKVLITPGIYKHFKGNLYFVMCGAVHRDESRDVFTNEIIYHPLYRSDNFGWFRISQIEFLEVVSRPEFNYVGPRFVKIMYWKLPNILPGLVFRDNYSNSGKLFEISRWFVSPSEGIFIECLHNGRISNFDTGYFKMHCAIQD